MFSRFSWSVSCLVVWLFLSSWLIVCFSEQLVVLSLSVENFCCFSSCVWGRCCWVFGPGFPKKLGQYLFLFLLLIKFAAKLLPSFRGKKFVIKKQLIDTRATIICRNSHFLASIISSVLPLMEPGNQVSVSRKNDPLVLSVRKCRRALSMVE